MTFAWIYLLFLRKSFKKVCIKLASVWRLICRHTLFASVNMIFLVMMKFYQGYEYLNMFYIYMSAYYKNMKHLFTIHSFHFFNRNHIFFTSTLLKNKKNDTYIRRSKIDIYLSMLTNWLVEIVLHICNLLFQF